MKINKKLSEDTIFLAVKLLFEEKERAYQNGDDAYEDRIREALEDLEQ